MSVLKNLLVIFLILSCRVVAQTSICHTDMSDDSVVKTAFISALERSGVTNFVPAKYSRISVSDREFSSLFPRGFRWKGEQEEHFVTFGRLLAEIVQRCYPCAVKTTSTLTTAQARTATTSSSSTSSAATTSPVPAVVLAKEDHPYITTGSSSDLIVRLLSGAVLTLSVMMCLLGVYAFRLGQQLERFRREAVLPVTGRGSTTPPPPVPFAGNGRRRRIIYPWPEASSTDTEPSEDGAVELSNIHPPAKRSKDDDALGLDRIDSISINIQGEYVIFFLFFLMNKFFFVSTGVDEVRPVEGAVGCGGTTKAQFHRGDRRGQGKRGE